MAAPRSLQFDTLSLHAGQRPDPVTGARAVPIYFTTSFVFRDPDHAAALFKMEPRRAALGDRHDRGSGLAYRRIARPLRRLAQSALLYATALRHRNHVRRPA